jgi:pyruvate-formate lyase-activating enzyme
LDELKKIVSNYKGKRIALSGGEPTLREDLYEVIRMVKDAGKMCHLVTNGLKLVERDFVVQLKDAGLDKIFLSLYSLNSSIEQEICGQDVLARKLKAIKNIIDVGTFRLNISMTVVPGINEHEIKNIFDFAVENGIRFLTIRSAARVGQYKDKKKLYFSELLSAINNQLSLTNQELLSARQKRYTPYFIYVNVVSVKGTKKLIPYNRTPSSLLKAAKMLISDWTLLKSIPFILSRSKREKLLHHIGIRIASWPDRYDIDLDETAYAIYQHLYFGKETKDFFSSMIEEEGL